MAQTARVTIAIPTYNRADSLRRATASALAQTYPDLRVVIADNASTDETPAVCAELASDPRVEVVRRPANIGLTANINGLFDAADTDYVMILADDDRIDSDWVERCVRALDDDPTLAICSGSARFTHADGSISEGHAFDALQSEPDERALHYFSEVKDNVTIYALMRRSMLRNALPMPNVLAGDWLLCARMLSQGTMRALPGTYLTRSAAGTSASLTGMARRMGVTRMQQRLPVLSMTGLIARDIAVGAPAHKRMSRRISTGVRCALKILSSRRYEVIEEILTPILAHRRLAPLDRHARRVSQRLRSS